MVGIPSNYMGSVSVNKLHYVQELSQELNEWLAGEYPNRAATAIQCLLYIRRNCEIEF
jgi:hypothetical protein